MDMKIRVFSIEEFSVYDGPGIRTTVFLKGCPLNCNWCHSPEGKRFNNVSLRSPNGCLHCNKCVDVCDFKRLKCVGCAKCIDVCPRDLIRMSAIDYDISDLVKKLLKNVDILNVNKGGITISGGEPLFQIDQTLELIRELKGKTHLVLQTSGYGDSSKFKEIVENLDLVLFDMKIMNQGLAEKFEEIDNSIIFKNFEILKNSKTKFIIRVPLIPGVIDTKENLSEIIHRIKDAKNLLRVELLPYNKYAGSKYKLAGMNFKPMYDENFESKPHLELFKQFGIETRVL